MQTNHNENGTSREAVDLGIDLATYDDALSIAINDARRLLRGRGGKPPSIEAVRRWASPRRGCPVGGLAVVLPAVKISGQLRTMPAWVEAFERMRQRLGAPAPPPPYRTPRQREAGYRRAEAELDRMGCR